MGTVRTPNAVLATKELVSPIDEEVHFTIKKASNKEDVERANLFQNVDYVSKQGDTEQIVRRQFPMGDLQLETVRLCLVDWNIESAPGHKAPINRAAIVAYLQPEERVFLYEQILDFNPIWTNREEVKSELE